MKTLYMIRHSLTEGNERRLYYGSADIPLTENGLELCARMRERFHLPEGIVYAHTGMLRAKQTLEALFGEHEARVYPALREMDMGRLEMLSYEDVKDDADFRAWCDDQTGDLPIPGGGESVHGYQRRILSGLTALLKDESCENMMLVCHGGTISHGMLRLFPEDEKHRYFYDWIPGACEGFAVTAEKGVPTGYLPLP